MRVGCPGTDTLFIGQEVVVNIQTYEIGSIQKSFIK